MGPRLGNKRLQTGVHIEAPTGTDSINSSTGRQSSPECFARRSQGTFREKSHIPNKTPLSKRVLVHLLPSSKENRGLAPNTELEASERIYKAKKVQNGDAQYRAQVSNKRYVGRIYRPKRCVSTHTHSPRPPPVAQVQGQRSSVRIPLSTVWSFDGSASIYSSSKDSRSIFAPQRGTNKSISRRLDYISPISSKNPESDSIRTGFSVKSRVHCKQKQMSIKPNSVSYLSGGTARPSKRSRDPYSREGSQRTTVCIDPQRIQLSPSSSMAQGTGPNGQSGGSGAVVPSAHETDPDSPPVLLQSNSTFAVQGCSNVRYNTGRVELVGEHSEPNYRHSLSHSTPSAGPDNGRFIDGLGGSSIELPGQGYLDHRGGQSSHQLVRTLGRFPIAQSLRELSQRQTDNGAIGQLNSCLLHKPARRDKIPHTLSTCQEDAILVHRSPDILNGSSHSRPVQHPGRQSFQGDISEPNGVVNIQTGGSNDLHTNVVANNRSVCVQTQPSTPGLLLQIQGPEGSSGRRTVNPVVRDVSLRIPADIAHSQGHSEGEQGRLHASTHSPVLARPVLVSPPSATGSGATYDAPSTAGPIADAGVESFIQQRRALAFDGLDAITQRFQKEGLSKKSAELAARGRRPSTIKIYSARLRPYYDWCRGREVSPTRAPIAVIADFLRTRFEEGLTTSTVRGYLSAIQAIHTRCPNGETIKDSQAIHFMIEAMNIECPRRRKIIPAWDLPTVLDFLNKDPFEPIQSASLRNIAIKTVFLIAVASGRRCSELHALAIDDHIVFSRSGVTLYFNPGFLAKNERSDFVASPIFLPRLAPSTAPRRKRLSCPVRALTWYLDRTRTCRKQIKNLFVTSNEKCRPAAKATMAGWLVEAISKSGAIQGEGTARAHSTRSVSSSWAFSQGVSIKEIVNTVAWRTSTTFITTYLRDLGPNLSQSQFARSVLQSSNPNL